MFFKFPDDSAAQSEQRPSGLAHLNLFSVKMGIVSARQDLGLQPHLLSPGRKLLKSREHHPGGLWDPRLQHSALSVPLMALPLPWLSPLVCPHTPDMPASPVCLLHCWVLPSLPKAKSRALLGKQSSTEWGYLPHLVCDQHFTVYKAPSPPLTDTSSSNTGELGLVIPRFKRRYLVSENEEPSSPKAQAERLGGEVLSGELSTCLLHTEPFLPAQALLTPKGPVPHA